MNSYFESNTDSESSDYWDEEDDEIDNIVYHGEELNLTKFTIVLCERYNRLIHGPDSGVMKNHYLTYLRFKRLNMDIIDGFIHGSNSLKLEIAECIYLSSGHCISIIKTFWLKIIQRKWKNIFREKKMRLLRMSNPIALKHREIYGKWSRSCSNYPQLKGMLYNLPRRTFRTSY